MVGVEEECTKDWLRIGKLGQTTLTIVIQPLVQLWSMLLQPFLASFDRTAKLAVLRSLPRSEGSFQRSAAVGMSLVGDAPASARLCSKQRSPLLTSGGSEQTADMRGC